MTSEPTNVFIVRHGQRLDEAGTTEWRQFVKEHPEAAYDPPLTQEGWQQAKAAGRQIFAALQRDQRWPDIALYSSPTGRTLSTSAAIAAELGGLEVIPTYSLNCCAAAQQRGVDHACFSHAPSQSTLGGATLHCWPPSGNAKHVNDLQRCGGGFVHLVKELVAAHPPGSLLILVTHREGIWQIQRHIGAKPSTKYCSIDQVAFDYPSNKLAAWPTKPVRKSVPRKPPSDDIHTEARCASSTLDSMLACGSGEVILRRGDGGTSTSLWKTPGVRGIWSEGGPVPNGELVHLLSTVQASEKEGGFVLVRRSNGVEGWAKIKNLHACVEGVEPGPQKAGCSQEQRVI